MACILVPVSTETAQLFFSLLAVAAGLGSLAYLGLWIARACSGATGARALGRAVAESAPWLAFLVAATATAGSLYFSEVAHFLPCRLCWFQRVAMYPAVGRVARRGDPA